VKIVYLILAHKHPEQLVRLVRALNTDETSFFVHVDKKTDDELYNQMVCSLVSLPQVHFVKRRKVYWGHFSQLSATIHSLGEIFSQNIPFDYVVLLSGQCYPIKPNSYIEKTLRENEPNSFMEYSPLPYDKWLDGGLYRIECWHFRWFGRMFGFPIKYRFNSRIVSLLWSTLISFFPVKRKFPRGFKPFGGSQLWVLSRECAEYLNYFVKRNRAFVNFFKLVVNPDEIFFQTAVMNSPFKERVVNDNLRYICWRDDPNHPAILRADDFENIAKSSSLFARKFDITVDASILDQIDHMLFNE
jgi:hypothetical protein